MTNSLKGLGIKDPYVGQPYAGKPEHTTKPPQKTVRISITKDEYKSKMTNSLKSLEIKDSYIGQQYVGKPEHMAKAPHSFKTIAKDLAGKILKLIRR